jgi:O-antigen/teichoic acid export membrane protein
MRNERRILLNTLALTMSEGLGQLANLTLIVSFARHFGASDLGDYSIAMSVGAVASIFVSLGVEGLLVRDISQDPACSADRLGLLLPAQLVLIPLAWLAATGLCMILIRDPHALLLLTATVGYQVLLPVGSLLLVPLQAREQMLVSGGVGLAHRLLIMVLGLLALRLGASAGMVALCFVAGGVALIAMAWTTSVHRCGRPRLRWSVADALRLYRRGMPFFGLTAMAVIYSRGTAILLGALATSRMVGLYAVADRLMIPLSLGPVMFNAAVYPALSRVTLDSLAAGRELCARCLRLLLVVTVPLAACGMIMAADVVQLVFGATYRGAAPALQVLVWTLPVRGAQYLLGSQLAALHRQHAVARARFMGLCAFGVSAPLLILTRGYIGAAYALLLCDVAQLMLYAWSLHRLDAAPRVTAALAALAAAVAVTAAATLPFANLTPLLRLPGIALVMASCLWAFGAVRLHDLRFLRALLNSKGSERFRSRAAGGGNTAPRPPAPASRDR